MEPGNCPETRSGQLPGSLRPGPRWEAAPVRGPPAYTPTHTRTHTKVPKGGRKRCESIPPPPPWTESLAPTNQGSPPRVGTAHAKRNPLAVGGVESLRHRSKDPAHRAGNGRPQHSSRPEPYPRRTCDQLVTHEEAPCLPTCRWVARVAEPTSHPKADRGASRGRRGRSLLGPTPNYKDL